VVARPTADLRQIPVGGHVILEDLGLVIYIASIGLTSAPSILALLEQRGWELPIAAIFLSLLPPLASLYIGRHVLHIEPAILCGASPHSMPARRPSMLPRPWPEILSR
jgi:uncharacterized transporter YbjL